MRQLLTNLFTSILSLNRTRAMPLPKTASVSFISTRNITKCSNETCGSKLFQNIFNLKSPKVKDDLNLARVLASFNTTGMSLNDTIRRRAQLMSTFFVIDPRPVLTETFVLNAFRHQNRTQFLHAHSKLNQSVSSNNVPKLNLTEFSSDFLILKLKDFLKDIFKF